MCLDTTAVQKASELYDVSLCSLISQVEEKCICIGVIVKGCNTYVNIMAIKTINQLRPQYVF